MYSFRVPLFVVGGRPDTAESEIELWSTTDERVWLSAPEPIRESERVTLRGEGYVSPEVAEQRARQVLAILRLTFLRAGVAADFAARRSFSQLSAAGLRAASEGLPNGVRVINESPGVLVHRSDEELIAFSMDARGVAHTSAATVIEQFALAQTEVVQTERAARAFDIYSGASRMPTSEASFLTLVTAVEALLQPQQLSSDELGVVEQMISVVTGSDLVDEEKATLRDRLIHLRRESIGSAGRRLARRLEGRTYLEMEPSRFFTHCYNMRSQLTHGGGSAPSPYEIGFAHSELARFVRDLIEMEFVNPLRR